MYLIMAWTICCCFLHTEFWVVIYLSLLFSWDETISCAYPQKVVLLKEPVDSTIISGSRSAHSPYIIFKIFKGNTNSLQEAVPGCGDLSQSLKLIFHLICNVKWSNNVILTVLKPLKNGGGGWGGGWGGVGSPLSLSQEFAKALCGFGAPKCFGSKLFLLSCKFAWNFNKHWSRNFRDIDSTSRNYPQLSTSSPQRYVSWHGYRLP